MKSLTYITVLYAGLQVKCHRGNGSLSTSACNPGLVHQQQWPRDRLHWSATMSTLNADWNLQSVFEINQSKISRDRKCVVASRVITWILSCVHPHIYSGKRELCPGETADLNVCLLLFLCTLWALHEYPTTCWLFLCLQALTKDTDRRERVIMPHLFS